MAHEPTARDRALELIADARSAAAHLDLERPSVHAQLATAYALLYVGSVLVDIRDELEQLRGR